MTFDEWREANYDTEWNERDYARNAWIAALLAEREHWRVGIELIRISAKDVLSELDAAYFLALDDVLDRMLLRPNVGANRHTEAKDE